MIEFEIVASRTVLQVIPHKTDIRRSIWAWRNATVWHCGHVKDLRPAGRFRARGSGAPQPHGECLPRRKLLPERNLRIRGIAGVVRPGTVVIVPKRGIVKIMASDNARPANDRLDVHQIRVGLVEYGSLVDFVRDDIEQHDGSVFDDCEAG